MVGSTGKERTNDGIADGVDQGGRGKAASDGPEDIIEDELWVKVLGADLSVQHLDARPQYNILRNAAACPLPGWITHEACRWSPAHSLWFFLPRKLCRDPYNAADSTTHTTLIMAVPEISDPPRPWGEWGTNGDGAGVLVQESPLPAMPNRGVSDFVFVPGTDDNHVFVLRTEVCLPPDAMPSRMSRRRWLEFTSPALNVRSHLVHLPVHNCRSGRMAGWYRSPQLSICSETS